MTSAFVSATLMEKDETMWSLLESRDSIRAAEILLLAYDKSLNIDGILRPAVVESIKKIQTEKVLRSGGGGISMSDRTSGGNRSSRIHHHSRNQGESSHSGSDRANSGSGSGSGGMPIMKKPIIKKKATSFDQAMKQKIMSELNKISQQNYKEIFDSIDAIYGRLSSEEHPWVLHLVLENASVQHVFAELYVSLFRELVEKNKDDKDMAKEIIVEFYKEHREKILTNVSNGENYDDFCEANKLKTSLIGLSIVLGEAANQVLVPPQEVGTHAMSLVKILGEIREKSTDVPKETTENGVTCVLEFFKVIGKTKAGKPGFQDCLRGIDELLKVEKTEKKLTPKARFAIMDFVDEMKKLSPPSTVTHAPNSTPTTTTATATATDTATATATTTTTATATTTAITPTSTPTPITIPASSVRVSSTPSPLHSGETPPVVEAKTPVTGGGTSLSKAFPSVSYRQLVTKAT